MGTASRLMARCFITALLLQSCSSFAQTPLRARMPLAFVGPEEDDHLAEELELTTSVPAALYKSLEHGLTYKELETGEGEPIAPDAVVTIRFTASIVSTGEEIQRAG